MMRPGSICECEKREIHGGRFTRCRKHATMRVRVVDTRTLGDVKDGQTEPTPGPWFGYCEDCGTAILRRQGATVEREEAR